MKALHALLSGDHERLDALLEAAARPDGTIDWESYSEFRRGLLRHIAIEEKVLFPAIRKERGTSDLIDQLHRDHAALAALLVPPPNLTEIEQIRSILRSHNPLEEDEGGLYEIAEHVAAGDLSAMLAAADQMPVVPVAPHFDTPITRSSIEQLLRTAEEGRKRFQKKTRA